MADNNNEGAVNPPSTSNRTGAAAAISTAKPAAPLDRGPSTTSSKPTGVTQPKPQALPRRAAPTSIIVNQRQKGNPVLNNIKSLPWEYGDIPADYVLGLTICGLFLSLKYHRLHPEYIYNRIRDLGGKFLLRVVLVMVDIENHEECLRELSKSSLINNVTLVLTWSAAECARYLELFKSSENASPAAIKSHQSTSYADRMVDFVTTPRSINKTDAVALVSQFGSLRTAVNARHEEVSGIAGWGEKKVKAWCGAVREPFRNERAAKRGITREHTEVERAGTLSRAVTTGEDQQDAADAGGLFVAADTDTDRRPSRPGTEDVAIENDIFDEDEEALAEAMMAAAPMPAANVEQEKRTEGGSRKRKPEDDALGDGVTAALNKLRKDGG